MVKVFVSSETFCASARFLLVLFVVWQCECFIFLLFFLHFFWAPLFLLASYMQTFFLIDFQITTKIKSNQSIPNSDISLCDFLCAMRMHVIGKRPICRGFLMQFQCIYEILNSICVCTSEYLFERISENTCNSLKWKWAGISNEIAAY